MPDARAQVKQVSMFLATGTFNKPAEVKRAIALGGMLALASTLAGIHRGIEAARKTEETENWDIYQSAQAVGEFLQSMTELGALISLFFKDSYAIEHPAEVGAILAKINTFFRGNDFNGVATVAQFSLLTKKTFVDMYDLLVENGCKFANLKPIA